MDGKEDFEGKDLTMIHELQFYFSYAISAQVKLGHMHIHYLHLISYV